MSQRFGGWNKAADHLLSPTDSLVIQLNDGQAASLRELAKRLPNNGVIIADEVGMGKTRISYLLIGSCAGKENWIACFWIMPLLNNTKHSRINAEIFGKI